MKTQIILFAWLCSGLNLLAQPAQLTREAYRDRVENYSQVLKQQKLKSMASTEGRKIAFTGFLPQIDITGEGTLNLKEMDAWNGPAGQYRNHTYQVVSSFVSDVQGRLSCSNLLENSSRTSWNRDPKSGVLS